MIKNLGRQWTEIFTYQGAVECAVLAIQILIGHLILKFFGF